MSLVNFNDMSLFGGGNHISGVMVSVLASSVLDSNFEARLDHRRSGHGPPPFSNFLFTNLFSIKFLYFFIISSLFPYFNLFVSIFIQSYVNNNLHVSNLYRYYNNPPWIISIYIGSTHAI